tara:strand:- start:14 stop:370 length:357 start_codon:yes stop_codon:yes gene_type:complete
MLQNNNSINKTMVPFVRDLVSLCKIHPSDFVREIGKVEVLKDSAKAVGVSKGSSIGPIVKGLYVKGTHKSFLDSETSRWEALSAVSNALGMRLNALLRACDVETGDSTKEALKELLKA